MNSVVRNFSFKRLFAQARRSAAYWRELYEIERTEPRTRRRVDAVLCNRCAGNLRDVGGGHLTARVRGSPIANAALKGADEGGVP